MTRFPRTLERKEREGKRHPKRRSSRKGLRPPPLSSEVRKDSQHQDTSERQRPHRPSLTILAGEKAPPRSIWREGMKTTAPGHAEGQKRGPPNPGEGSPHSPLWNMGVLGARSPRAPRIQFRREEGSGPQGPGVSSVPAGRPRLGGRGKPTGGHRDSPAPPARPY